VPLTLRQAASSAELRAAAAVRAAAFGKYPAGRSAFAIASHQRMRVDAEWKALEEKTSGREAAYAACVVACFVLLAPCPDGWPLAAGLDPSCRLPAPAPGALPSVVLASLDLNTGPVLPAEELHGAQGGPGERAYLSNVAVAPGARRCGLARRLICHTAERAAGAGVRHLYVHAAADNAAALALYAALGFAQESAESAATEHALGRARRVLLRLGLR